MRYFSIYLFYFIFSLLPLSSFHIIFCEQSTYFSFVPTYLLFFLYLSFSFLILFFTYLLLFQVSVISVSFYGKISFVIIICFRIKFWLIVLVSLFQIFFMQLLPLISTRFHINIKNTKNQKKSNSSWSSAQNNILTVFSFSHLPLTPDPPYLAFSYLPHVLVPL